MAARIVESLFLCTKRWALEAHLVAAGHRWPKRPTIERTPMSGAELLCRVLCWLDTRSDPHGRMYDVKPEDVEQAAQWVGEPGVLVSALIDTGWIDQDPQGMRWHGYASLNRLTINDRNKKRDRRGDNLGDSEPDSGDKKGDRGPKMGDRMGDKRSETGDRKGDNLGDKRAKTGASVSESGRSSEGSPRTSDARASRGALEGPPVAAREAEPERAREHYPPGPVAPLFVPPPRRLPPPPKSA